MKIKLYFNILSLLLFFIACSLPANSSPEERYDKILAKLERIKDIQSEQEKKEAKEQNIKEDSKDEKTKTREEADITPENWVLTFDHAQLPDLNGVWLLTKKTIKRKANPVLSKPITFVHCASRLPFEKRDFEEKEVVISLTSPDSFSVMAIYPITDDIYYDPNQKKDIVYQNFSFKGIIRPENITYAYTLKLKNHMEEPALARQLWLNGKLKFEHISQSIIKAKGYEVEYTPECRGFIIDEIAFEFKKQTDISGVGEGTIAMSFFIEQAANAAEIRDPDKGSILPEQGNIPNENKSLPTQFNSAKDKSGFEASNNYKPIDIVENQKDKGISGSKKPGEHQQYQDSIKVPGMW